MRAWARWAERSGLAGRLASSSLRARTAARRGVGPAPVEALPKDQPEAPPQPFWQRIRIPAPHRDASAGSGGTRARLDTADRLALALLALAALYRLALILRGWPALDSDEAVIGLMARHILYDGQFPYWFWGQQYMGAFQAYFAAPFFALFGSSALVLHFTVLLLTLGWLVVMYRLGRAAFGPAVGLLTLGWLAFGPALGVLRQLTAIGGYQETLLFGALILWGVWSRLRQPDPLPHTRRAWRTALLTYSGIGLAGGLGLWSDLLIVPVLIVAAVALLASRPREIFHLGGAVLVLAFFIGGFPYISYNITNKNATYKQIVRQSRPEGHASSLPTPQEWRAQVGETLAVALPAALGSPYVCLNQGVVWQGYPPAEAQNTHTAGGFCDGANIAFSLAVIAVYLLVAWQILSALLSRYTRSPLETRFGRSLSLFWRWAPAHPWLRGGWLALARPRPHAAHGHPAAMSPHMPEETARLWLRLMLLGVGAMTLALYTTSIDAWRYQFTSARYLLPLYLTTPILFGFLWRYAAPILRSLSPAAGTSHLWPRSRAVSRAVHWPFMALGIVRRLRLRSQPVSGGHSPQATGAERTFRAASVTNPPRAGTTSASSASGPRAPLAAFALVALLALSLYGGALTFVRALDSSQFAQPVVPPDQALIAFLDAHHITAFYGDYWVCYRVAFETNERLLCAVRGQNGDVGLELINNRNNDYVRRMAQVAHPAYILPAGTPEDVNFAAEAAAAGLPHDGYHRSLVSGYAVYYYSP